jgi:integration host factor subunit beta
MDLPVGFSAIDETDEELQAIRTGPHALPAFRNEQGGSAATPRLKRREEAERLVSCLLEEVASALERGMPVELRGLGALSVKAKRGRQGRNPRTGEAVTIEARRVVRFRASGLLIARLNRRTNQRPQRSKSDPRQLAFPIEDPQAERAGMEAAIAPPRLAGGGKAEKLTAHEEVR